MERGGGRGREVSETMGRDKYELLKGRAYYDTGKIRAPGRASDLGSNRGGYFSVRAIDARILVRKRNNRHRYIAEYYRRKRGGD